jgi:transcriptional antiterminator NusG
MGGAVPYIAFFLGEAKQMSWHVLFVMTGYEDKIAEALTAWQQRLKFGVPVHLFMPKRKLIWVRRGEKQIITKALFPGYVLVQSETIDPVRSALQFCSAKYLKVIRDTELSSATVSDEEIAHILRMVNDEYVIDFSEVLVEKDRVRVISGPLLNYEGDIVKIDKKYRRATIKFEVSGHVKYCDIGVKLIAKIPNEHVLEVKDFYFLCKGNRSMA